jgi:hypothetical protein
MRAFKRSDEGEVADPLLPNENGTDAHNCYSSDGPTYGTRTMASAGSSVYQPKVPARIHLGRRLAES